MAGYLLARAGVPVVLLEKHSDFNRDFRGDTIHPSTLELMHELGLLDEFLKQPHQEVRELRGVINGQASPCSTVALTRFGENSFCLRYARRRMPPSFPAPSTASFWPDSLRVMVPALLTTTLRGSKAQDDAWARKAHTPTVGWRCVGPCQKTVSPY